MIHLKIQLNFPKGPQLAAEYRLLPLSTGYQTGYNADINGQVVASFSAATGRVFHSLVRGSARYFVKI